MKSREGLKYLKNCQKKIAWLLTICLILGMVVGNGYDINVLARETRVATVDVNIDGDNEEWERLVQNGVAKKVGEGSTHKFGTVTTTAGALYLATDGTDLYYYVEAQVPNWGDWGMILDLALYVEGQGDGVEAAPWGRGYTFTTEKKPQYHLLIQNKGENEVAQAILLKNNNTINVEQGHKANIQQGYEGKISLRNLGITKDTNLYAMAVITGNSGGHTAFNVIPQSSSNELAEDYTANPPKQLGEYGEVFSIIADNIDIPPEPEYISPEVKGNQVTFRYYKEGNTEPVRVAGDFNDWANSKDSLVTNDEGIGELTLTLTPGRHEYKFIVGANGWIQDPKNLPTSGDNSIVIVSGLSVEGAPLGIQKGKPIALPTIGTVFDTSGVKHEKVPVVYDVVPVEGLENDQIILTDNEGLTQVEIKEDYPLTTVKLKAVATVNEKEYIREVTLKVENTLYTYTINYLRLAADYEGWNLWLWADGQGGIGKTFDKNIDFEIKDDSMSGKRNYTFKQTTYQVAQPKLNFITRQKVGDNEWAKQDKDRSVQVPQGEMTEEVWIVDGDEKVYTDYNDIDLAKKVKSAFAESGNEVLITVNKPLSDLINPYIVDGVGKKETVRALRQSDTTYTLELSTPIEPNVFYEVGADGVKPAPVIMRGVLDDYYYDGDDLGLSYSQDESTFKVWAPTAKSVKLYLYDDAGNYNGEVGIVEDHSKGEAHTMDKGAQGIWQTTIKENLDGQYYMYQVTLPDGTVNYALDPYARATSTNGGRTAIIDLSSTNPSGWSEDERPPMVSLADTILYELHVRDFSVDKEIPFENPGKFKAFTEEGLTTPQGNKAGIDHLEELGVTHIHLLPVYDFAEVDESKVDDESYTGRKFNWGYDPQNYNVPEGSYATDTTNPATRIKEFKEMVAALHKHNLRVVMDVVYNHTFSVEEGPFNKIVPGYYYRTTDEGNYSNGSGCGNEVASQRPMVRKYIKDSVKYWASEYNIDGFRFDLMGLIDTTTMTQITQEVRNEIDPTILIYGEPWTASSTPLPQNQQTLKGSQKDKEFAVFNDEIRGAIKGGSDDASKGFATGGAGQEQGIVEGIQGAIHTIASQPTEVISYVTAHDNLNLWDKIITTQGLTKEEGFLKMNNGVLENGGSVEEAVSKATIHQGIEPGKVLENETVKRSLLANGIILTSQGIPFLHAGDEMLRSKYGDHNSYRSPDAINQIRWEWKDEFEPVMDYYKGLINLRKQHPAFRMQEDSQVEKSLQILTQEDNVVAFRLKDYANGDKWENIVVIYNGNTSAKKVTLPHMADWKVVVDHKGAGVEVLSTLSQTASVSVEPLSMMVLYDHEDIYESIPTTLEVSTTKLGLPIGGKATVKATVKDQKGAIMSNAPITWEVEDESIIAVNKGNLIAYKEGKTLLHVRSGALEKTVELIVVPKLIPTKVFIASDKDFVYEGLSIQLEAKVEDQFGQIMLNSGVTWSTDTPELIKVEKGGKVTGLKEGMATVKATIGEVTASLQLPVRSYERRYVVLEYNRPDGNYTDWDVWVWNTGVKEDQIEFTADRDGKKVAYIEVGPSTNRIGFIIRKENWAEKDVEEDRFITLKEDQIITKVQIESKQKAFKTLAPSTMPVINPTEFTIDFNYRDNKLFKEGRMDTLKQVQVEINNELYNMVYNEAEERFEFKYEGLEEKAYSYCYHVTYADGTTKIYNDPYNSKQVDGKSMISYERLDFNVEASAYPYTIDYTQNSVITLDVEGDTDQLMSMEIDLTSIGGSKIEVDKDLMAVTIGVNQETTLGEKTLPIILKDKMNNVYNSEVKLEVKERIRKDKDDFDWDEAVIYFMLTDRFNNGNTGNDDPYGLSYDKQDPGTYHGGDFKGVTDKLDYLKALGINTIWVSPVVENIAYDVRYDQTPYQNSYYAYHGYWAKNFEKLNPHFGTVQEFHTLIDEAHARGMKIMVDVVINHAGYGMDKAIDNPPEGYPTDEDRQKFEGMLRTGQSSDEVTGQLSGLPDFETERSEVRDQIIDWQVAWVDEIGKTAKGNTIDYFRVDTVKHVEDDTWMAFKNELTKVKPDFKLIGEAWGASVDNDLGYLNSGMMDAVLNFNFKSIAKQFVEGHLEEANRQLEKQENSLSNVATVGNFLSSHDEDGFLKTLGGNEDLFKVAVSLQATAKGQPVIYYGEELGYSGANNYPQYDNRPDIDWTRVKTNENLLKHYQKVFNFRNQYAEILAKGTRNTIGGSDLEGYLAFSKSYKQKDVVVVLNTKATQSCTLQVPFKPLSKVIDAYSGKTYTVSNLATLTLDLPDVGEGGTILLVQEEDEGQPEEPEHPGNSDNSSSNSTGNTNTQKDVEITKQKIEQLLKEMDKGQNTLSMKVKEQAILTVEAYRKLQEIKKDLELNFGKVSIRIGTHTLSDEALKDVSKIIISLEEMKDKTNKQVQGDSFLALSKPFKVVIQTVDQKGKKKTLDKVEEKLLIQVELPSKEIPEGLDTRKIAAYEALNGEEQINNLEELYRGGFYKEGTFKFEMKELKTYYIGAMIKHFEDISETHWAKEAIEVLASRFIVKGMADKVFMPKDRVTNAEFAVLLGRMLQLEVSNESWYEGYVNTLVDEDIMSADQSLRPHEDITREEMAYMLGNAYAYKKQLSVEMFKQENEQANKLLTQFKDEAQISEWTKSAVELSTQLGFIKGYEDGSFLPQQTATRADAAQMVIRFLDTFYE